MLTKAFVVLVTVLAILLVALQVSSVAQYDDLRGRLAEVDTARSAAESTARLREQQRAELEQSYNVQLGERDGQVREARNQVTSLQAQLASAQESARAARTDLERWEASLERLSAAETLNAAELKALNEELVARRQESVEQRTRLIESTGRIAELSTQSESLEAQVRRMRERLQAIQEANREMENRLARAGVADVAEDDLPVAPSHTIAGQITRVQQRGDDVLVQVNVGENDGVSERMEFMVHRGERFLGRLVIDAVEPDSAVGHLRLIQDEIREQDAIYAGGL